MSIGPNDNCLIIVSFFAKIRDKILVYYLLLDTQSQSKTIYPLIPTGPVSIRGRVSFLVEVLFPEFSVNYKTNMKKFNPPLSPDAISHHNNLKPYLIQRRSQASDCITGPSLNKNNKNKTKTLYPRFVAYIAKKNCGL